MSHHRNAHQASRVDAEEDDRQYYTSMVMMASNYTGTTMRHPPRTRHANTTNTTKPTQKANNHNNNSSNSTVTQKKALQGKKVNTSTTTTERVKGSTTQSKSGTSAASPSPAPATTTALGDDKENNVPSRNSNTNKSAAMSKKKSTKQLLYTNNDKEAEEEEEEESVMVEEKDDVSATATVVDDSETENNDGASVNHHHKNNNHSVVVDRPYTFSGLAGRPLPHADEEEEGEGEQGGEFEEESTVSDYDYDYFHTVVNPNENIPASSLTYTGMGSGMMVMTCPEEDELGGVGGSSVQLDITFPDPTTISTVDKDGVWSYRHNPYSRSVSTVVSQCSSVVSSSSSFVGDYTPPPPSHHQQAHHHHVHCHHPSAPQQPPPPPHHQPQSQHMMMMMGSSFCSEHGGLRETAAPSYLGSSRGSLSGSVSGCEGPDLSAFDSPTIPLGYGSTPPPPSSSLTAAAGSTQQCSFGSRGNPSASAASSQDMLRRLNSHHGTGSHHHTHSAPPNTAASAFYPPGLHVPRTHTTTTTAHYDPAHHTHSPILQHQSLSAGAATALRPPFNAGGQRDSLRHVNGGSSRGANHQNSASATGGANVTNSNFIPTGNVQEQFDSIADQLDVEACTARGRQLLVHVLRLRDAERSSEILSKLLPSINVVSLDGNGCHVIRALVENMPTAEVLHLIHGLYPTTIFRLCTSSQHTRRVVQSIFEHHHGSELTPLIEVLANDACRLAVTQQGCIVIMSVLSHATLAQKALLLPPLMPILATLATDQYGNYVVQALFDNREGLVSMEALNHAFGKYRIQHSCNKCASNVMEKLVSGVSGITRRHIVQEFVFDPLNCHTLLLDCYGNFVLQAIIKSSTEPAEFQVIYDTVVSYLPNSPYGQKIGAKLHAKYREIFQADPPPPPQASTSTSAPVPSGVSA